MYYYYHLRVPFAVVLLGVLSLFPTTSTAAAVYAKRALGPLPLSSRDRWIVDAKGNHVPYVGVNWPGAADTMIPEGLQYQSIEKIVGKIVEIGFNAVRLTFAIEMVDDILDGGGDVSLAQTLTNALGQTNGPAVLQIILAKNPQFTPNTTRLQVGLIFSGVLLKLGLFIA
jgi:hypothetical protein